VSEKERHSRKIAALHDGPGASSNHWMLWIVVDLVLAGKIKGVKTTERLISRKDDITQRTEEINIMKCIDVLLTGRNRWPRLVHENNRK